MSGDLVQFSRIPINLASLISIKDLATLSDREVDILNGVVEHQIRTNPVIIDALKKEVERAMKELGDSTK